MFKAASGTSGFDIRRSRQCNFNGIGKQAAPEADKGTDHIINLSKVSITVHAISSKRILLVEILSNVSSLLLARSDSRIFTPCTATPHRCVWRFTVSCRASQRFIAGPSPRFVLGCRASPSAQRFARRRDSSLRVARRQGPWLRVARR